MLTTILTDVDQMSVSLKRSILWLIQLPLASVMHQKRLEPPPLHQAKRTARPRLDPRTTPAIFLDVENHILGLPGWRSIIAPTPTSAHLSVTMKDVTSRTSATVI